MDNFGVPKKINRHVLNAIYFLKARGNKSLKCCDIMKIVQTTIKRNAPNDLPVVVFKSLKNLTKLGVIRKCGTSFLMHNINEYKEDRKSKLDPNMKKRRISESSSEGDVEKSRKRFCVNPPFVRKGQEVELPKVRTTERI